MNRTIPALLIAVCLLGAACASVSDTIEPRSWDDVAPDPGLKVDPADDPVPPEFHVDGWSEPVPVSFSTAGAEDSAFVTADGSTLFLFSTPDLTVPVGEQLGDGATGLWMATRLGDDWADPVRVVTTRGGEQALDGCGFYAEPVLWFCSVRAGNDREIDIYRSTLSDGVWSEPEDVGEPLERRYLIGELHVTADGSAIYYHALRPGGQGDLDIWVTRLVDGEWLTPENVGAVNTAGVDGWPFVSQDGTELWFTRIFEGSPAIFRSMLVDDSWSQPELIVSSFAGEPSLDAAGNLYFTHHLHRDGVIVEADIYVAVREGNDSGQG